MAETLGADISFLLDGSDYNFRVMYISDMVEMLEAGAFYEDPTALEGGHVYWLHKDRAPKLVQVEYLISHTEGSWLCKTIEIRDEDGVLIASSPYKIPFTEAVSH